MKISPQWLRDFVDLKVDVPQLARDLTAAGITVEGTTGSGDSVAFEMEITTNRPDAMNHYGVAREASAIYNLPLRPLESKLPAAKGTCRFFHRDRRPHRLCSLHGAHHSRRHH